jgi:hypothetical protein
MSHIEHVTIPRGPLTGRWCYHLLPDNSDKTSKLGLGSNNTSLREDEWLFVIVHDPNDEEFSAYSLLHKYISTHLPPGYTEHVFLHKAPMKVIKERRLLRNMSEANWTTGPHGVPKGKMGKNAPSEKFKAMAFRCNFEKPDTFTGRGARRTGITQLAKTQDPATVNLKSRHKSFQMNHLYQDPCDETKGNLMLAFHQPPPSTNGTY